MQDYSTLPLLSLQPKTKEIPLTQGKVAIVDAADYEWLSQWKWTAVYGENLWYARRNMRLGDGRRKHVKMHRAILDAPLDSKVDHRDGNGLNNTRDNLRLATTLQNNMNARLRRDSTSGYKGVSWNKASGKWCAYIRVNGKRISLGFFASAQIAAARYDEAAIMYFGEFAWTNFAIGIIEND